MSESVLLMCSSKNFIVSDLTFRSLIHFEFIFMYGVRRYSSFILLHVVDQFSQHHLLKIVFSPLYIFAFLVEDKVSIGAWIYLWAFHFVPSIILFWWLLLCSMVQSWESWFLQFQSSFSRLFWLFEAFLCFHIKCEIICSSSMKNTIGSLIGIVLNL